MDHSRLKPYDFVRVEQDGYAHLGEVMAYPSEGDTVYVRTVAGDPTSARHLPLSQITHVLPRDDYRYMHYAVVSGTGCFPVDMLRYDFASPVNFTLEEDEHGRPKLLQEPDADDALLVARPSRDRKPNWTDARWASFLWRVEHQRTVKLERGS